ncbi:hypothetical protein PX554_13815 [Sphingomonas sp. H39-1-10]|uniref:DUF6950 family protein n=1 Tax=Sphingomonas pollutisoli TaxID=3030829 RepID=UPI0023B94C06|nr:hypothetical protein [Sphingomonas pollutisoli]MDF0489213.1 hypothetical protein [Sphingomonas pollutisoli]
MYRKPDWDARLAAYLEPLRLRPFAWGSHDCCTFAAGAVEAMTGVDPMPEFRGRYSTAIGSARAITRFGKGTVAATLDSKFEPVAAALAHRGDIVMTEGLLGICWGAALFAVGSEGEREGLVMIDRRRWVDARAWRVQYGF